MPTTVAEAFAAAGLTRDSVVPWGAKVPTALPGVYLVSLSKSASDLAGVLDNAPLDLSRIEHWLAVRPELSLDGGRPSASTLAKRLGEFWLADEAILYIGLVHR
jgi:hypothetical protein